MSEHDQIVTAWAESASGPGWANQPVWYLVRSRLDGSLRVECLQPREQSPEIMDLYAWSKLAHARMTKAVEDAVLPRHETRGRAQPPRQ